VSSIRIFLVAALLSSITLVIFVASLRGYQRSMEELQALFDGQLLQKAELLGHDVRTQLAAGEVPDVAISSFPSGGGKTSWLYQVWRDTERCCVLRSAGTPETPLLESVAGFQEMNYRGYRWRALVVPDAASGLWLLLAERDDLRYRIADRVVIAVLTPIVLGLPILALIIWGVVSRGMQPISRLASELESRGAGGLKAIELRGVPRELEVLANSANDLLRRLEASFQREKRFAADAAHELRTPIAAIRVHLQNLVDEFSEPGHSMQKLREGVDRLSHLVEQTLVLNRVAPDQYMANFVLLDLYGIAQQVIADRYPLVEARKQEIQLEGEPTEIRGDRFGIEMLVLNLVSNAIKYTPESGHIEVGVSRLGDRVHLYVMDSGPGIPESEYQRVFERFYRVGGDRHNSGVSGCGLGLSIVQRIVVLHGAEIELAPSRFGSGLKVTVIFPRDSRAG
jgi:two-component system sensor histidine kinase QseC